MGKTYFKGWYFKHVTKTQVFAFIVSIHKTVDEGQYGCIQMISEEGSYLKRYDWQEIAGETIEHGVTMGGNSFSLKGIHLCIQFEQLEVSCDLGYSEVVEIDSPIMGPFGYLRFLECSHTIYSLSHNVSGMIKINGIEHDIINAVGYIEGDEGRSFPKSYLWSQCNYQGNTVFLAVGKVPLFGIKFQGVIGHIYYNGTHYRLATYKGARITRKYDCFVRIKQKKRKLVVNLLESNAQALQAPDNGHMIRTIQESVTCRVRYQFFENNKKIFDFVSDTASFEYDSIEKKSIF